MAAGSSPVSTIASNTSLAMRPLIVLSAIRSSSPPSAAARHRAVGDRAPGTVQRGEQIAHHPVGGQLRVAALRHRLENNPPSPARPPARRHRTPPARSRCMKRRFFASGSSGSFAFSSRDPGLVQHQRQQVRIGEVAIIVRVLLAAHRPRRALLRTAVSPARPCRPTSHTSTCRFASASIACMTKRTELTFFTSQRVRYGSPCLRTDTLTSARMEPSSMLPSQVPR